MEAHNRRLVPKRVHLEWPRSQPPPREADEEEEEGEVDDYIEWKAGDVCECLDIVGAPLATLGLIDLGGKLVPKEPGMYWKVRVDAVEHVWPGFTEDTHPLIVCKVTRSSAP